MARAPSIWLTIAVLTLTSASAAQQPQQPPVPDEQQPTATKQQTATKPPKSQRTSKPQKVARTQWYKKKAFWTIFGVGAGMMATGGYLVSDGSTGRRIGGGVVIGVGGFIACLGVGLCKSP